MSVSAPPGLGNLMVGNDAGWALSFYTDAAPGPAEAQAVAKPRPVLRLGRDQYYAEIEATLPNGDLTGGSYRVVIEGLIDDHYAKIAPLQGSGMMRLYLYWRDTNTSIDGYLSNVLGVTDLVGAATVASDDQLKSALVAEIAIVRVARRLGTRRYETEIQGIERAVARLSARMTGPFERKGYGATAVAMGSEASVNVIPYCDEKKNPDAAATLDLETVKYPAGRTWLACLRDLATKLGQRVGKGQRGYLLSRDDTLYWGIRPIPLLGGAPTQLDPAGGLIETHTIGTVPRDPNRDADDASAPDQNSRRQFRLTLKGRPDVKPGEVVSFVLPDEDQVSAQPGSAVAAVLTASAPAAGAAAAWIGLDSPATTAYVESVQHRLGRTSAFVTVLTCLEMKDSDDGWDTVKPVASRAHADDHTSSGSSADTTAEVARQLRRLVRNATGEVQLSEVGEVRAVHPKAPTNATGEPPSQTVRIWQGLRPPDGTANQARRLPVQRGEPMKVEAVAYASPFAWGKCGLVLPRYPGTRVLLDFRNGEADDPVDIGALWESGTGPDSSAGDWWLSLPAGVSSQDRESIADSDRPPASYTGKVTNDLTDADGRRIIEVAGLTIAVGGAGLPSAGQRPDPSNGDGKLTITHSNQKTALTLSDGRIELKADDQTSIVLEQGKITLKTQGVTATLDASKMDVS